MSSGSRAFVSSLLAALRKRAGFENSVNGLTWRRNNDSRHITDVA
jgi:hypothetical protein